MKYTKVDWLHNSSDSPTLLYRELDSDRWEVREVKVYANGGMGFADRETRAGRTTLGVEPLPPVEQIAADPEFEPVIISADEFGSLWLRAIAE